MKRSIRIRNHPVLGIDTDDRRPVRIFVDGVAVTAREGESLAAALWASGYRALRNDTVTGSARGMYCGIGHCYECRVTVNGVEDVRSCLTPVQQGMHVSLRNLTR